MVETLVLFIPVAIGMGVTVWRITKHLACKDACLKILSERITENKKDIEYLTEKIEKEISQSISIHSEMNQKLHTIIGKLEK